MLFLLSFLVSIAVFFFLFSLFYVILAEKYDKKTSIFLSFSFSFLLIYFFKSGDFGQLISDLGILLLIIFIFYIVTYGIATFKNFDKEEVEEKDLIIPKSKFIVKFFLLMLVLIFLRFLITVKFENDYLKALVYGLGLISLITLFVGRKK
jgi:hypothetical protein